MTGNAPPAEAGIEAVGEAIIMQAMTDLFYCLLFDTAPIGEKSRVNVNECEAFFRSGWFMEICQGDIDGEAVIAELRDAANRAKRANYFVRRKGRNGKYEVFDKTTGEAASEPYEYSEDASKKAAMMNHLTVWQYNILLTGQQREIKGGRGRRKQCEIS